ncbi:glycosyltransferase [Rhizobium sp. BK376]|uniref:glycosyltransferase n=1 Tax=Rhizobium sp. BK376 TaxID=2512149 RepID=UPI0010D8C213|nr:glycosyltransferase [Rhizobium sp. BK376]TCR83626.1 glycosyl transferase family 2 [Rhizobium sp. BK376]
MPSLDVAIPNYNYGHYLEGCVKSILRQNVETLRVLIIDNASTDDSARIARKLATSDPRIELRLRSQNLGPHASFNEGIDWAQSDYFLILCSDDLLTPHALADAVSVMEEHPQVNLTYGEALFLKPEDVETRVIDPQPATWSVEGGTALIERLCRSGRNPISGPTVVVRTAIQKAVGHYNPELTHTDDLEMWLRIAARGQVAHTNSHQAIARVHSFNQSSSVKNIHQWNLQFEAAYRSFFRGDGASLQNASEMLRMVKRALSDRSYSSALSSLSRGDLGSAQLLLNAIRLRPAAAVFPPVGYLAAKMLQDRALRKHAGLSAKSS